MQGFFVIFAPVKVRLSWNARTAVRTGSEQPGREQELCHEQHKLEAMDNVKAVYFSATGTTRTTVCQIARKLAGLLALPFSEVDFTLPAGRQSPLVFGSGDVVVMGTPVYAGRVPNVLLKFLQSMQGQGAVGIPVVVYGNRHFDDALIELRDLMEKAGIRTFAAAAFVGEHSFSKILAAGRPDAQDLAKMDEFASLAALKLGEAQAQDKDGVHELLHPVEVEGTPFPYRGYYTPRDRHGNGIDIRKVKSLVNGNCNACKICAEVCPMGSISWEDVREYTGICIKCGACIKKCPVGARYYEDEGYLYHQHELEEMYTRRAEPVWFL